MADYPVLDGTGATIISAANGNASVTTVALLPATPPKKTLRMVTDATVTTFASIVAGGGANTVPVFYDGTNWRIG